MGALSLLFLYKVESLALARLIGSGDDHGLTAISRKENEIFVASCRLVCPLVSPQGVDVGEGLRGIYPARHQAEHWIHVLAAVSVLAYFLLGGKLFSV